MKIFEKKFIKNLFLNSKLSFVLKQFLGLVLIIIGATGIFLPIVPGLLLIFLGLSLIFGKKLITHIKKSINKL